MSVHTVALETMPDAVTTVMCQMEALLLSSAMARRLNLHNLCLVGGLSTSPYFVGWLEQGLKSKFELTQIVPQRPILSVEGSAYLAITDGYIKARILRLTYGLLQSVSEADTARRHRNRRMNK